MGGCNPRRASTRATREAERPVRALPPARTLRTVRGSTPSWAQASAKASVSTGTLFIGKPPGVTVCRKLQRHRHHMTRPCDAASPPENREGRILRWRHSTNRWRSRPRARPCNVPLYVTFRYHATVWHGVRHDAARLPLLRRTKRSLPRRLYLRSVRLARRRQGAKPLAGAGQRGVVRPRRRARRRTTGRAGGVRAAEVGARLADEKVTLRYVMCYYPARDRTQTANGRADQPATRSRAGRVVPDNRRQAARRRRRDRRAVAAR